jgi:hypothetical protein
MADHGQGMRRTAQNAGEFEQAALGLRPERRAAWPEEKVAGQGHMQGLIRHEPHGDGSFQTRALDHVTHAVMDTSQQRLDRRHRHGRSPPGFNPDGLIRHGLELDHRCLEGVKRREHDEHGHHQVRPADDPGGRLGPWLARKDVKLLTNRAHVAGMQLPAPDRLCAGFRAQTRRNVSNALRCWFSHGFLHPDPSQIHAKHASREGPAKSAPACADGSKPV